MDQTQQQIWTVSDLTVAIKGTLEPSFAHVTVQGEISNCKLQSSGHLYFTLKDTQAQLPAVMFRIAASTLSFQPKDGDKVCAEGSLTVYAPAGRYQLQVRALQKQGLGELLLRLEQLKREIHARGWFKPEHKKKLPLFPRTIGVVTSPTGAAIQDILNVLTRRFSGYRLILNPVKVQGEGAAEEIAAAIRFFNEKLPVDVMIVGRGGGSLEDLWCFNEEIVAAAIYRSAIPIICAVGHETDHTIAEYVADVRAATPSAAAEIVMAEREQQCRWLAAVQERWRHIINQLIKGGRRSLRDLLRHPLFQSSAALLAPWLQKMDDARQCLEDDMQGRIGQRRLWLDHQKRLLEACKPSQKVAQGRRELSHYQQRTYNLTRHRLQQKRQQLNNMRGVLTVQGERLQQRTRQRTVIKDMQKHLQRSIVDKLRRFQRALAQTEHAIHALNPTRLLERGYSVVFDEIKGSVITNAAAVAAGDPLRIRLRKGEILATVEKVIVNE